MGRDDSAPTGLGASMVQDAARRVHSNKDIAAWGLTLEAEDAIHKLVAWYKSVGFTEAKIGVNSTLKPGTMYAAFHHLLPGEIAAPPAWKTPKQAHSA